MSKLAKTISMQFLLFNPALKLDKIYSLCSAFSIKLLLPQRRIPRVAADALPLSLSLTHSLASLAFSVLYSPLCRLFRALSDNLFPPRHKMIMSLCTFCTVCARGYLRVHGCKCKTQRKRSANNEKAIKLYSSRSLVR
jgi:hypothetical protein